MRIKIILNGNDNELFSIIIEILFKDFDFVICFVLFMIIFKVSCYKW